MLHVFCRIRNDVDRVNINSTIGMFVTTEYRPTQGSNYGGARGGLAHLKDLAAPAKHLL